MLPREPRDRDCRRQCTGKEPALWVICTRAPDVQECAAMLRTELRVAVVDDDEAMRVTYKRILRAAKLDVELFASGVEFLASLQNRRPDCVILDLEMPELDGLAVQARLREADSLKQRRVVWHYDDSTTCCAPMGITPQMGKVAQEFLGGGGGGQE
jgi:hypothetical protein